MKKVQINFEKHILKNPLVTRASNFVSEKRVSIFQWYPHYPLFQEVEFKKI